MKKIKFVLLTIGLAMLPVVVAAQNITIPKPGNLPGTAGADVDSLALEIIQVILGAVGIIAVLFLIIGGFEYILSGANEELAERGKKTIRNAILGLIIVILSYVIVTVVANTFLGVQP